MDAFGFQFAIKLLNESFERRALEFEPEFANGLGEYLLKFRSSFLEIDALGYSEFYTTEPDLARQGVSLMHIVLWARWFWSIDRISAVAQPKDVPSVGALTHLCIISGTFQTGRGIAIEG